MPNDDWRKRASKASRECMHLAIRASDVVIPSSLGISSLYDGRGA
jgi:hypothetical protein